MAILDFKERLAHLLSILLILNLLKKKTKNQQLVFLKCVKVLSYFLCHSFIQSFRKAIELDSIYTKERRTGSETAAETSPRDFATDMTWPYIEPLVTSPKVTSLNAGRTQETYSSSCRKAKDDTSQCWGHWNWCNPTQMARLVLHQVSPSEAELHPVTDCPLKLGLRLYVPHDGKTESCMGIFLQDMFFKIFNLSYLLIQNIN